MHRHIDPLARVSRDGPLIDGGVARRIPWILEVVEVGCAVGSDIARPRKEFLGGITGAVAIQKEILRDPPWLCGDDGCEISGAISGGVESLLNLRHRLLGGGSCEHLGLNLRGVVACGDLLCAGGREK